MNIICEYIKYKSKAKGRHQIHSPFVYNLVDVCFELKVAPNDKRLLKKYKEKLYTDKRNYDFDFFGAGSKRKRRSTNIKKHAKNAGTKGKYWDLLYKLSSHYKPTNILELGTNFGFGTLAFKLGFPEVSIESIEGSKTLHSINQINFNSIPINKINLLNYSFESFFKQKNDTFYDIVFIDGDHIGNHLLKNIENVLKNCHSETLIIIDDIRWSTDMLLAWKQIIADKRFNLTIDLFKLGIILLMPSKEKEHFILKY